MAALTEVVDELFDATMAQSGRGGGGVAVSSQAAAELDCQDEMFAGRSSWKTPIRDAHLLGDVALLVASDSLRAYAALAGGSPPPIFAHLVVARAAADASVNSAWLNQPGPTVTPDERARRGLVERYHAALQRRQVPELRATADQLQEELKRIASAFRWTLVTGDRDEDLSIGGTRRPPTIPGARALLATGDGGAPGEGEATGDGGATGDGARLWEHMAQAMHGSWHQPEVDGPASTGGRLRAAALLHLYLRAAQNRADLMGWQSRAWEEARTRAGDLARQLAEGAGGEGAVWAEEPEVADDRLPADT